MVLHGIACSTHLNTFLSLTDRLLMYGYVSVPFSLSNIFGEQMHNMVKDNRFSDVLVSEQFSADQQLKTQEKAAINA
jgi:hypothetical protein